jgi:hypothetical protein
MKVEFKAASAIEFENVVIDQAAQTIKGSPLFYGKGLDAVVMRVQVLSDDNKPLKVMLLKISGVDGSIKVDDRTKPVKPYMERPHKPRKAAQ